MSIEHSRTELQRPLDTDGFELPPWSNPYFAVPDVAPDPDEEAEAEAAWEDAVRGDASTWPYRSTWDEYHWELGPEPDPEPGRFPGEEVPLDPEATKEFYTPKAPTGEDTPVDEDDEEYVPDPGFDPTELERYLDETSFDPSPQDRAWWARHTDEAELEYWDRLATMHYIRLLDRLESEAAGRD